MPDTKEILAKLYAEKVKLDQAIALLEDIQSSSNISGERRGRKSMTLEERQEVSERMRKYWSQRRQERAAVVSR